jgi:hypothetical protein
MKPVDQHHRNTPKQPSNRVQHLLSGFKKTGDSRVIVKSGDSRISIGDAVLVRQVLAQKSVTEFDPEARKIVAHVSGGHIVNTTHLKR